MFAGIVAGQLAGRVAQISQRSQGCAMWRRAEERAPRHLGIYPCGIPGYVRGPSLGDCSEERRAV